MVPDERIPGTLNVGLAAAAVTEAVIFVGAIEVEPHLLISMILSATAGSWLGADVVARLSRRAIQITMGIALLIAGGVFTAINLHALPGGGTAMSLVGWKFPFAVGVNFILGALMSAGIGLYAPCMITLALLGMHPIAAFPIMMGACALLQPVASLRFFQTGKFAWGASLGLTFGGVVGVLIAAFIVKSLPLEWLRWLVILVIVYAALAMMRSAAQRAPAPIAARSTSMSITLRRALRADIPLLAALIERSAHGLSARTTPKSQVAGALRGAFGVDTQLVDDGTYFVAEEDGVLADAAAGAFARRSSAAMRAPIATPRCSIRVPMPPRFAHFSWSPSKARRGVGSLLLERCESEARERGFSRVELMATLPGVRLYAARGYVGTQHVSYDLGNGEHIDFVPMSKQLR